MGMPSSVSILRSEEVKAKVTVGNNKYFQFKWSKKHFCYPCQNITTKSGLASFMFNNIQGMIHAQSIHGESLNS